MSNRPNNPAHKAPATNGDSAEVFEADSLLEEMKAAGRPFVLGGETFVLPAPTAWPDEAFERARSDDPLGASRLILGDDYDRFVAAGGNSLFLQRLVEKLHGASVGESSASSSS